jgi:hypothetical protein
MKWIGVNLDEVETTLVRGLPKFSGLRFQIPRGLCQYGRSEYKTINVEIGNKAFITWWREMEGKLCQGEPFNSNLKGTSLRLKLEDDVPVFDDQRNYIGSYTKTGDGAGKQISCLIEISGVYFFNNQYGLTVKCVQLMAYADEPPTESDDVVAAPPLALLDSDDEPTESAS